MDKPAGKPQSIRTSGVVTGWYGTHGFIQHAQGEPDALVCITSVEGHRELRAGQQVEFELHKTAILEAQHVKVLS